MRKITLVFNTHSLSDINSQLKWICESIGLFPVRDYDSSVYRIFIELIKDAKLGNKSSSDELAQKVQLTRGTVVHHLNRLMALGIVIRSENQYILKEKDVKKLINSMKTEINDLFEQLEKVADKIDKYL